MENFIFDPILLIGLLLTILIIPQLHLFLILMISSIDDWIVIFLKKICNLLSDIYDIILHILGNPVFYIVLLIYLYMSIS
jgi:hypothetical protein